MYLPTFYKLGYETWIFKAKRMSGLGPVVALWGECLAISLGVWAMYPSLYNMVYTDIIPPARGSVYCHM